MIIGHFHYLAVNQLIKLHLKRIKGNLGSKISISQLYFKGQTPYQPVFLCQAVEGFNNVPKMILMNWNLPNLYKKKAAICLIVLFLKHPILLYRNNIYLSF